MDTHRLEVGDVMFVNPILVHVKASVEEADIALRSTFIMGIPVVDSDGRLVGTISHAQLVSHRFARRHDPDETDRSSNLK